MLSDLGPPTSPRPEPSTATPMTPSPKSPATANPAMEPKPTPPSLEPDTAPPKTPKTPWPEPSAMSSPSKEPKPMLFTSELDSASNPDAKLATDKSQSRAAESAVRAQQEAAVPESGVLKEETPKSPIASKRPIAAEGEGSKSGPKNPSPLTSKTKAHSASVRHLDVPSVPSSPKIPIMRLRPSSGGPIIPPSTFVLLFLTGLHLKYIAPLILGSIEESIYLPVLTLYQGLFNMFKTLVLEIIGDILRYPKLWRPCGSVILLLIFLHFVCWDGIRCMYQKVLACLEKNVLCSRFEAAEHGEDRHRGCFMKDGSLGFSISAIWVLANFGIAYLALELIERATNTPAISYPRVVVSLATADMKGMLMGLWQYPLIFGLTWAVIVVVVFGGWWVLWIGMILGGYCWQTIVRRSTEWRSAFTAWIKSWKERKSPTEDPSTDTEKEKSEEESQKGLMNRFISKAAAFRGRLFTGVRDEKEENEIQEGWMTSLPSNIGDFLAGLLSRSEEKEEEKEDSAKDPKDEKESAEVPITEVEVEAQLEKAKDVSAEKESPAKPVADENPTVPDDKPKLSWIHPRRWWMRRSKTESTEVPDGKEEPHNKALSKPETTVVSDETQTEAPSDHPQACISEKAPSAEKPSSDAPAMPPSKEPTGTEKPSTQNLGNGDWEDQNKTSKVPETASPASGPKSPKSPFDIATQHPAAVNTEKNAPTTLKTATHASMLHSPGMKEAASAPSRPSEGQTSFPEDVSSPKEKIDEDWDATPRAAGKTIKEDDTHKAEVGAADETGGKSTPEKEETANETAEASEKVAETATKKQQDYSRVTKAAIESPKQEDTQSHEEANVSGTEEDDKASTITKSGDEAPQEGEKGSTKKNKKKKGKKANSGKK